MSAHATCARPGCGRELPRIAVRAGDPYCSMMCCRIALGLEPSKPQEFALRVAGCKGCGCPMDEATPGCETCRLRHSGRARRDTQRQAA